jgi:hypothetical protein
MRLSVAIILFVQCIHAVVWGLFRSLDSAPDHWKLATIALLIGMFLSLPILRVDRSSLTSLFYAISANIVGGGIAVVTGYIGHSQSTVGATSAITFGAALLVPLVVIVLTHIEAVATVVFGAESFATIAIRRIAKRIKKTPQSNAISENYVSDIWPRSLSAACGLFVLSLIATYIREYSTAILSLFLSLVVVAHIGLTKLRVRNGSFASNAPETAEIISYILAHYGQTGRPPGGQLSTVDTVHDATREPNAGSAVRGET